MGKMTKKKPRFALVTLLLLAGAFALGSLAGVFIYATGSQVLQEPRMAMVSHTEYRFGEAGQIIARITDFQGNAVAVTSCNATILYPNKTAFVTMEGMTAGGISGDFYYGFTTPAAGPEGVYEYQATCFYAPSKNATVTNSFHLSSAFNSVLGNLTGVSGNLTYITNAVNGIAGNLTSINSSLASQVAGVGAQVGNLSLAVEGNFTNLNAALAGNFSVVQSNFSQVLAAINNVSVNLTPLYQALAGNFTEIANSFTAVNNGIQGNFTALNAALTGNFTVVNDKLDVMNATLNSNTAYLVLINATTSDTYTYLTGTLATNVNTILSDLGVINATVNRIETLSTAINSTTNTILTNQQNAVNMQVFSG
jgi:hypothetical protein